MNITPACLTGTLKKTGRKACFTLTWAFNRLKGNLYSLKGRSASRVQVFEGLSGSGKTRTLIKTVNRARKKGREVRLFLCSESHVLRRRPNITEKGYMACRVPGLTCPVDHFVTTEQAALLLAEMPSGSLAAFDEAYWFGPGLAPAWVEAARRGVELLIVLPSAEQKVILAGATPRYTGFKMLCQRCSAARATGRFVDPESDQTLSTCASCRKQIKAEVTSRILKTLEEQEPSPGQKQIYYPVFLCSGRDWKVQRPDALRQLEIILALVEELQLVDTKNFVELRKRPTYLDLGCQTGYFCRRLAEHNFIATGVDNSPQKIELAALIDNYFTGTGSTYLVFPPYDYLRKNRSGKDDLVTAFSTLQRIIINDSVDRGLEWLQWLFARTKRLLFLEVGYATEPHYRGLLSAEIDRDWVLSRMEDSGLFERVILYESNRYGLKRDLFAGIRSPGAGGEKNDS